MYRLFLDVHSNSEYQCSCNKIRVGAGTFHKMSQKMCVTFHYFHYNSSMTHWLRTTGLNITTNYCTSPTGSQSNTSDTAFKSILIIIIIQNYFSLLVLYSSMIASLM